MKKMRNLKLSLNRETLAPLTDNSLDQVNGGNSIAGPSLPGPSKLCKTVLLCPQPSMCDGTCGCPRSIVFRPAKK